MPAARKNTRRADRLDFAEDVKLTWEESGYPKLARGTGCNLSETGMSCRMLTRVPERTQVRVECQSFGQPRYAMVRHCTQKGTRYVLGLEFR